MSNLPTVLLHGYSDRGESFETWGERLEEIGRDPRSLHLGSYISLSNEITIRDLAEGLDRALRIEADLGPDQPFDAIVHSTGGLVIREWLATYAHRRGRVKHIINLAPATFGSPMAAKGRSVLGAIFKGERDLGPDFMEAGDRVLSGLELGSSYTWDLAHKDLLAESPFYGPNPDNPYPFVFVGLKDYGWLKRIATERGTDGTVRWSGVSYNCRKMVIDLTRDPARGQEDRIVPLPWQNAEVPLVLMPQHDHGSILRNPDDSLVNMVAEALAVDAPAAYEQWSRSYASTTPDRLEKLSVDKWQQFVIRAVDERGDPITDYYVEICQVGRDGKFHVLENYQPYVHAFAEDTSYRCFQVNLGNVPPEARDSLGLRITALSGTELVAYHGEGSETFGPEGDVKRVDGKWDAQVKLSEYLARHQDVQFFMPFTTTLLELRMNRAPMPPTGANKLVRFLEK